MESCPMILIRWSDLVQEILDFEPEPDVVMRLNLQGSWEGR